LVASIVSARRFSNTNVPRSRTLPAATPGRAGRSATKLPTQYAIVALARRRPTTPTRRSSARRFPAATRACTMSGPRHSSAMSGPSSSASGPVATDCGCFAIVRDSTGASARDSSSCRSLSTRASLTVRPRSVPSRIGAGVRPNDRCSNTCTQRSPSRAYSAVSRSGMTAVRPHIAIRHDTSSDAHAAVLSCASWISRRLLRAAVAVVAGTSSGHRLGGRTSSSASRKSPGPTPMRAGPICGGIIALSNSNGSSRS